ncbi:hypothetical protein PMI09_01728 [Rhizobium sp. CF122]|nr:hypothetical protein PMI09_01728 [Rhizobium sp. CF122]
MAKHVHTPCLIMKCRWLPMSGIKLCLTSCYTGSLGPETISDRYAGAVFIPRQLRGKARKTGRGLR